MKRIDNRFDRILRFLEGWTSIALSGLIFILMGFYWFGGHEVPEILWKALLLVIAISNASTIAALGKRSAHILWGLTAIWVAGSTLSLYPMLRAGDPGAIATFCVMLMTVAIVAYVRIWYPGLRINTANIHNPGYKHLDAGVARKR